MPGIVERPRPDLLGSEDPQPFPFVEVALVNRGALWSREEIIFGLYAQRRRGFLLQDLHDIVVQSDFPIASHGFGAGLVSLNSAYMNVRRRISWVTSSRRRAVDSLGRGPCQK